MSTSRGSGPERRRRRWRRAGRPRPRCRPCTWKPTESSSGTTTAPDASLSRASRDDVGDLGLLHVDERLAHVEVGPGRGDPGEDRADGGAAGGVVGAVRAADEHGRRRRPGGAVGHRTAGVQCVRHPTSSSWRRYPLLTTVRMSARLPVASRSRAMATSAACGSRESPGQHGQHLVARDDGAARRGQQPQDLQARRREGEHVPVEHGRAAVHLERTGDGLQRLQAAVVADERADQRAEPAAVGDERLDARARAAAWR